MRIVKSLLLGSAAVLAAATCGQAADLPFRKAAPVEYVRVCDWTGAGFFYIPGTDTCLKIGGFIRAEYEYNSGGKAFVPGVPTVGGTALANGTLITARNRDESGFFIRGRLDADARTQTAYGTLRTYVRYQIDRYSGAENFTGSYLAPGANPAGAANSAYLDKGFVQFAGLTAGRVQSFFDFGADPYGYEGVATSDASSEVLAYTATFGGGFSATLSMEDPNSRRLGFGQTSNATAALASTTATNVAYSGLRIPDIVGQINVTQAWGQAQLAAAYHQLNTSSTTTLVTGKDDDGYAVRGGLLFKLPMLAVGDEFQVEAAYENGAYYYQDSNGFSTGYSSNPTVGGLYHPSYDGVAIATAGGGFTIAKSEGWSVSGGFVHFFTPNFNTTIFGSYQEVDYGSAKNLSWLNGGIGKADTYRIADQLNWLPVKDLLIGVEVMYIKIDQKVPGTPGNAIAGQPVAALPAGISKSPDAFETRLRVERDF